MSDDKIKLESIIDVLYLAPQKFDSIKATEVEAEIRDKLEGFKRWAKATINEKIID